MSGHVFTDSEGVVLTLDFTDTEVLRAATAAAIRYTTTSRKPGVTIAKPLRHELVEGRHFVLCECGSYRWSDDVPHAARVNRDSSGKVDCMGRPVEAR